jgi:hypothetical protein
MRWIFVLVFVLVLALAWGWGPPLAPYFGAGVPRTLTDFPRESAVSPEETWVDAKYPFNRLTLPPPEDMIAMLRVAPRVRKNADGCSVLLLRGEADGRQCDAVADHFTEELRATQVPHGSHYPSMWDTWISPAQQKHIIEYAPRPLTIGGIRAKLAELAPPVVDTNPALVHYLIKKCAKRAKKDTFIDTCAGWGGQAAGACAADVRCYHGYLPFDNEIRPALAQRLSELLETCRGSMTSDNEFWIRQMAIENLGGSPSGYDMCFCHENDLVPLASQRAWDVVRPGGWVVLFCGGNRHSPQRMREALKLTSGRRKPTVFGLRRAGPNCTYDMHALVWEN